MNLSFLIPFGLGIISVGQAGLNRRIASQTSIQVATLTSSMGLLIVAVIFYLWNSNSSVDLTTVIKNRGAILIIPGILGFFLVAGIPWAIGKWGASFVFVWLIGSQMAAGLLWDFLVESRSISPMQLAGAGLSLVGALCFSTQK